MRRFSGLFRMWPVCLPLSARICSVLGSCFSLSSGLVVEGRSALALRRGTSSSSSCRSPQPLPYSTSLFPAFHLFTHPFTLTRNRLLHRSPKLLLPRGLVIFVVLGVAGCT